MTNEPMTFQNENMSITATKEKNCIIKMKVHLSNSPAQIDRHKAIKNVAKEVSVPGFRKGKAPESLLLKHYEHAIEKEWRRELLNNTFREAIKFTKITTFNDQSILSAQIESLSTNDGAILTYEYEAFPDVPVINVHDLELSFPALPAVETKAIENYTDNLLLQNAKWTQITDRPIQEGDFVDISVDVLEEPIRNVLSNAKVSVIPDKLHPGIFALVLGATHESVVEGTVEELTPKAECGACESGEEHVHEETESVITPIRVTIHKISIAERPLLDDAFALKLGAENVDDLKAKVLAFLTQDMKKQYREEMDRSILRAIDMKYRFDIPLSPVSSHLKEHRNAIQRDLINQGIPDDKMPGAIQNVINNMAANLRFSFLFRKFAEASNISITQSDVSEEWSHQIWLKTMGRQEYDLPDNTEAAFERIGNVLLKKKVLDKLLETGGFSD